MTTDVGNPNPEPNGEATEAAAAGVDTVAGGEANDVIATERPADLPESFWDADAKAPKYGDIAARLARADELEQAETARKEGVPTESKDYKFEVDGEPILGLDGQPAAIDPANPLVGAVAGVAHKHGLPQAVVADLTRAFIETQVQDAKGIKEALDAEVAKLGEKARDRVTAVQGFIKQHCGESADAAIEALGTAGSVQAWEAVMAKLSGATITTPQGGDQKPKTVAETWFPNSMSNKAA